MYALMDALWNIIASAFKCIIAAPVGCYFNALIKSLWGIIIAMALWILLFGFIYDKGSLLRKKGEHIACEATDALRVNPQDIMSPYLFSALTFFEMQPADDNIEICSPGNYVLLLELILAYAHLGILISYLYQRVSRK